MDYKILASHVVVKSPTEFHCLVAIDAANDCWKAYEATLSTYPDWKQIQEVAFKGKKLTTAAAAQRFPEMGKRFATYGW